MDRLDQDGQTYAETARKIARDVSEPVAADVDEQARFPQESIEALGSAGLLGLCVPERFGGREQPPGVFTAVTEELAQRCASTAMVYVMHVAACRALVESSVLGHRDQVLREIASGHHLSTLAFSERGSRSQFWAPVSKLEECPGGGYVTSARKSWVTSASGADSYVATAQSPQADSPLDSTLYLLRPQAEGVRVDGSFQGLGLRGNDSAPVTVENLQVSSEQLITEPGGGSAMILETVLPWFALGTAAMAGGICQAAVTSTAHHLSSTGFDTDGRHLRDLPNLRARLAEMSVRTEQSRALLARTVEQMERGNEKAALSILQTRLAALEAALHVTDLAMKACGGAAFSKHLGIERLFRDARAGWVMAPTADHLNEFIGRSLTGLPMF